MLAVGSLVLYKNRLACVKRAGGKLDIELDGGEIVKVRPKDVLLLHPGPVRSVGELQPPAGEVQTAWELLAGGKTTLPELAELAYGAYTPGTAWAAWQLVDDGLYFYGDTEEVLVRTPEEVAQEQAAREAVAAEKRAWESFLERASAQLERGSETGYNLTPGDAHYLKEVEGVALRQSSKSRVLRKLGRDESPENAHALLLELGYWDETVNPYPQRFDVVISLPEMELPELPEEARLDLTHLLAFAIDDEGTETPDDAVSLEGGRLWVHVADAAALVCPGSPVDLEAYARATSLYLPEKVVHMLPRDAIQRLGLGLTEVSPALSFGLDLDSDGRIVGVEVTPSWVRVTRLTYEEAEAKIELEQKPFKGLYDLAQLHQARRRENGAIFIDLPEVKVRVDDGEVALRLLSPLKSRELVEEAMLMTGEAAARFALEHEIPFPFATQEPPEIRGRPADAPLGGDGFQAESLSEMFALRRTLKRSQYKGAPAPHAGVGLAAYAQVTSPLRRYLDTVAHQQLRAYLRGEGLLDEQALLERIGAVEAVIGSTRQVEQLSIRHWTLVYLLQHYDWRGEGVVVEKYDARRSGKVLIPELGLEAQVSLPGDVSLDSTVSLVLEGVNLPYLDARFRVEEPLSRF